MQNTATILLSIPRAHEIGKKLKASIESVVIENNIIITKNMKNLSKILCKPLHDVDAAVICRATRKGLIDLLPFREMLLRIPVILILPDQGCETIAKGHSFRPRYLSYMDSDFSDVRGVLQKMIGKQKETIFHITHCN